MIASGLVYAFLESTIEGKLILVALFLASIFSWAVMVTKFRFLKFCQRQNARFLDLFHQDREPLWLPGVESLQELNETPEIIRSELRIADFNRAKALQRPQLTIQEILDYQHLHPVLKPDLKSWLETQPVALTLPQLPVSSRVK